MYFIEKNMGRNLAGSKTLLNIALPNVRHLTTLNISKIDSAIKRVFLVVSSLRGGGRLATKTRRARLSFYMY